MCFYIGICNPVLRDADTVVIVLCRCVNTLRECNKGSTPLSRIEPEIFYGEWMVSIDAFYCLAVT